LARRVPAHQNLSAAAYKCTTPVGAYPTNGYGLSDMIGNVWEWTTDWFAPKHEADAQKSCCIPENPRGGRPARDARRCSRRDRPCSKQLEGAPS
jgi:formylglycine-generating enzyme required for sulfatase activity